MQINPNSYWLVIYECRPSVILVSHKGDTFFAHGQDEEWHLSAITEWIQEIPVEKVFQTLQTEGTNTLSVKQCADQFRNYAKSHPSIDSKSTLNFCAEFLDQHAVHTERMTYAYERKLYLESPPAPIKETIKKCPPAEVVLKYEEEYKRVRNQNASVRYDNGWYRILAPHRKLYSLRRDDIETEIIYMSMMPSFG